MRQALSRRAVGPTLVFMPFAVRQCSVFRSGNQLIGFPDLDRIQDIGVPGVISRLPGHGTLADHRKASEIFAGNVPR